MPPLRGDLEREFGEGGGACFGFDKLPVQVGFVCDFEDVLAATFLDLPCLCRGKKGFEFNSVRRGKVRAHLQIESPSSDIHSVDTQSSSTPLP